MTGSDHDIRRLANGAIDIDFYRRRGRTLRSVEMTAFLKSLGTGLKPLIVFTVMASLLFAVAL